MLTFRKTSYMKTTNSLNLMGQRKKIVSNMMIPVRQSYS